MKPRWAFQKTAALTTLANAIYKDAKVEDFKTNIGIVATRWVLERPMIFKANIAQAHGRKASFAPFFGVPIGDAVQASCSAYPYFKRKMVVTLYAIADALVAMQIPPESLRVVSLGVGTYPSRTLSKITLDYWKQKTPGVQLLQKTLEINTQSMDQLRAILYKHVSTVRINQSFSEPAMATDLFEHDLKKLNILTQRGVQSFADSEVVLKAFLV
jgi:uncharacterized protein